MSKLLSTANKEKKFEGVVLPDSSIKLTHLQFADDVILFIRNVTNSITGVKKILQCFEILSGLHINFNKSCIYDFGDSLETLTSWATFLGCQVGSGSIKYPGAVIEKSLNQTQLWEPLLAKIKGAFQYWRSDSLSLAGRLVLVKATIDSMPLFWFNLFRMPKAVLSQLEKLR